MNADLLRDSLKKVTAFAFSPRSFVTVVLNVSTADIYCIKPEGASGHEDFYQLAEETVYFKEINRLIYCDSHYPYSYIRI